MPSFNPLGGGRISSVFGYRVHPITGSWEYHEGLDINGKSGAPIYSTAEGTVVFSGWRQGYGVCVGIDHGNGFSTLYAHNTRNIVYEGEHVKKGQIIGYVGSTGSTTGVHCHYEVHFQNRAVDPARFLSLDIKDAERY